VFGGEAVYSFASFCDGARWNDDGGIYYRSGDDNVRTPPAQPIANLDDLPMPAWEL
jgi:hypothetical protein